MQYLNALIHWQKIHLKSVKNQFSLISNGFIKKCPLQFDQLESIDLNNQLMPDFYELIEPTIEEIKIYILPNCGANINFSHVIKALRLLKELLLFFHFNVGVVSFRILLYSFTLSVKFRLIKCKIIKMIFVCVSFSFYFQSRQL